MGVSKKCRAHLLVLKLLVGSLESGIFNRDDFLDLSSAQSDQRRDALPPALPEQHGQGDGHAGQGVQEEH